MLEKNNIGRLGIAKKDKVHRRSGREFLPLKFGRKEGRQGKANLGVEHGLSVVGRELRH